MKAYHAKTAFHRIIKNAHWRGGDLAYMYLGKQISRSFSWRTHFYKTIIHAYIIYVRKHFSRSFSWNFHFLFSSLTMKSK